MKKVIILLLCAILTLSVKIPICAEEQLLAKSAVLIDGENGRILYGKEPEQKMAMASTTKIMTCIVALENCEPDQVMTVSEKAAKMPKVHMNAIKGEQYYMKDLLYAMMLESYNDVAAIVAENAAGSMEAFAKLMNQKAKEIGAVNTNFVTPNGLDADNHYSTAYDMALIGAYAVKNDEFVKIVTTSSYSFQDLTGKRNVSVSNKDAFLTMDKDSIGIKTGFTGNAGYCFVGAVKSNGRLFVSCVLACGWPPNKSYKWHDTKLLMNIGKENFNYKTVLEDDRQLEVAIDNGTKNKIVAQVNGNSRMLVSDQDQIEMKTFFDYQLPVKRNDTIGHVDIYINNQKVEQHKIVSMESVRKYDYKYCLEKAFGYFIFE
ncbi:MAG: D-alanyl-D-alanine carboxypeptidase family protein [Eubacterium sp.]